MPVGLLGHGSLMQWSVLGAVRPLYTAHLRLIGPPPLQVFPLCVEWGRANAVRGRPLGAKGGRPLHHLPPWASRAAVSGPGCHTPPPCDRTALRHQSVLSLRGRVESGVNRM